MPTNGRIISFAQAIREATEQAMDRDPSVLVIGESVPDPKGIFGTTAGLQQKFGSDRVQDMPVSENGLTGVCIGAALNGFRPILVHARVDFALLSLDQLVNNASKWHYMFGQQQSVPLVVRMLIGHGWGQGCQHSQHLQAIFAHFPGLKVVMPSNAYDAKGMLAAAIRDPNPVIFIEHRWLHTTTGEVPEDYYEVPIGPGRVVRNGSDITLATTSYMTLEALRAASLLARIGVDAEIVDIRTLRPFQDELVQQSVKKTGRLMAIDLGWETCGFAGEIIAKVTEQNFSALKQAPVRITAPDLPSPSSPGLTKHYYPRHKEIARAVLEMLGKSSTTSEQMIAEESEPLLHDVPDPSFTGPF